MFYNDIKRRMIVYSSCTSILVLEEYLLLKQAVSVQTYELYNTLVQLFIKMQQYCFIEKIGHILESHFTFELECLNKTFHLLFTIALTSFDR